MSTAASKGPGADRASAHERRPPPTAPAAARADVDIMVLVMSDNLILGEALERAVVDAGYRAVASPALRRISGPVGSGSPDVAVVDVAESSTRSVPVMRSLRDRGVTVVALVESCDDRTIAECLEAGAEYICDYTTPLAGLLDTVRNASLGVERYPTALRVRLLAWLVTQRVSERAELEPFRRLTSQERQVLALLIEGDSPSEIAAKRVVSIATVRSQIRSVLGKLHVRSQLAAAALARQVGWEPDEDVIDLRDDAVPGTAVPPEPRIAG